MNIGSTFRTSAFLGLAALFAAIAVTRVTADEGADKASAEKKSAALPTCPVMGDPIDPSVKLATDDGPLWFCCTGCVKKYQKDTAKYADKVSALRAELAKLPKVQVTCPISGEPIDPKVTSKMGDETVAFCCPRCKAKFDADPDAYKAELANCYTIQRKCPFTDEPINPSTFVDFTNGQRVYTCCDKCATKLKGDPAGCEAKLAAVGIHVDPEKVKKDE